MKILWLIQKDDSDNDDSQILKKKWPNEWELHIMKKGHGIEI